jgi:hypothetical protein
MGEESQAGAIFLLRRQESKSSTIKWIPAPQGIPRWTFAGYVFSMVRAIPIPINDDPDEAATH